ncbi:MAG: DMT family transporter [Candidatus Hydrothermia bacterium]
MINAFLSVLLWATQATAFKLTLRYTNPFGLLLMASITSFLCLLILYTIGSNKTIISIFKELRENLPSALLGLLNPFLYYTVLFNAYNLLKAQEALILNYLWPIMLTILTAIFLKKPFTILKILALIISFSGAALVVTKGNFKTLNFTSVPGTVLAIISTLLWATYWLLNMKDKRPALQKLFYNFFFGTLYLLLLQSLLKLSEIKTYKAVIGGIYVGLFEMGITFFLWLKALEKVKDTARVNNVIYLAPFMSLLFINFILKEKLNPSSILGLLIITVGILIQELSTKFREVQ